MTRSAARQLAVACARDLGPQFVHNPHRMIGQDGAFSIPLNDPDGSALWFFGDTLIGSRLPGQSLWCIDGKPVGHADMSGRGTIERMINNTALVLRATSGRNGLRDFDYICDDRGQLRPLIPLVDDEHPDWDRIWCQHGLAVGERIYLSFIKVRMLAEESPGPPLPVPFEIVGSGLAVGSRDDWRFERITRDGSSILWKAEEPHFATAFLLDRADGIVYLYGSVKQGDRQNCYVARSAAERLSYVGEYEYLTSHGPTWSRNLSDAVVVFSNMPSELSVSFNAYLGCYLAVHSLDLTGKIVARTAARPWGPWSEPVVLWTVATKHEKPPPYPVLIYAGKEHPELSEDDGRVIYLTYIEFEEYFPHLVEIELM
jgi:hypothetical protein